MEPWKLNSTIADLFDVSGWNLASWLFDKYLWFVAASDTPALHLENLMLPYGRLGWVKARIFVIYASKVRRLNGS